MASLCLLAVALRPQIAVPQVQDQQAPGAVIQVHVNSVLVPVVVRDAQGHAMGNLKQEDFEVFDQGKQRPIVGFTLQQTAAAEAVQPATSESAPPPAITTQGAGTTAPPRVTAAKRFVVFLFDDRHLGPADLEQVKEAAGRMLEAAPSRWKPGGCVVVPGRQLRLDPLPYPLAGSYLEDKSTTDQPARPRAMSRY